LLESQRYAAAEQVLGESLAIREKQVPESWLRFNAASMLGGALLGQKKYDEAKPQANKMGPEIRVYQAP
jgi:eukaryotic-like serine/threonine-protein kinase